MFKRLFKVMAPDGVPQGDAEQLSFMSDLLDNVPDPVDDPPVDEPPPSLDSEFEPNLDEPPVDEPAVDEVPPADPVDPPVADEPSVEETLRAQLVAMAAQLEALQGGQPVQQIFPTPQQAATTDPAPPVAPVAAAPAPTPAQAYLTEEELDQIIDNPALILTAIQRAQADITNQFAANLPSLVGNLVNQQVAIQSIVTEFYDQNKDLRPHADYVKYVMRDLESKHRDKPFQEILQLTADESRKKLGLKNPANVEPQRGQSTSQQKPAFAGTRRAGTQRPAAKSNELFDPAAADMLL